MARSYLVFDIETIVDWDLLYKCEHKFGESTDVCLSRFRDDLRKEQSLSEFEEPWIPSRYHAPVSIAFIAVDGNGHYLTHRIIDDVKPAWVTREFWSAVQGAKASLGTDTLVSFNGKHYDMPVMEVNGLRHGALMSGWFNLHPEYASDNLRARFNNDGHLDIYRFMVEGAGLGGNLDYWTSLVGLPGKVCMDGSSVGEEMEKGYDGLKRVSDYCMADVLATTGLLLHLLHCTGDLQLYDYSKPIKSFSECMDSVVENVAVGRSKNTPWEEDGCVDKWIREYHAAKANSKTAESLAEDDYIPF